MTDTALQIPRLVPIWWHLNTNDESQNEPGRCDKRKSKLIGSLNDCEVQWSAIKSFRVYYFAISNPVDKLSFSLWESWTRRTIERPPLSVIDDKNLRRRWQIISRNYKTELENNTVPRTEYLLVGTVITFILIPIRQKILCNSDT